MAEAKAESASVIVDYEAESGSVDEPRAQQLQSVLPLLSLTTTALSFSTLTRVLFRIAFQYK